MENYHIKQIDACGFPTFLKILFEASIDDDIIKTFLNVVDGVDHVNINAKNCKKEAVVYLSQDKANEIDSVLKRL